MKLDDCLEEVAVVLSSGAFFWDVEILSLPIGMNELEISFF